MFFRILLGHDGCTCDFRFLAAREPSAAGERSRLRLVDAAKLSGREGDSLPTLLQ